jgi:hypothetical protein
MKLKLAAVVLTFSVLALGIPLYAHHAFSAEFDNTKPLNMKGKFVKMDWVNPHSWVHFEVTLPNGQKQVWQAETPPPNNLVRQGWQKTALQVGDEVQVGGFAAKNGTTKMWASNVFLTSRDGKALDQPKQLLSFAQNPDAPPGALLPPR